MPPQTKDKICWINLNVFVYCTVKLSIISAKTHTGLFIFWDTSSSPGPFVLEWNSGWIFPNHESVSHDWERVVGEVDSISRVDFFLTCDPVHPRSWGLTVPLWPGPGNLITVRPPSLFAIQTQFCDNLVTIMLQLSSARDDPRDPLASKQTNKKFLSFQEDFLVSASLNKQNQADDATKQSLEMISQMLHLTSNPHFLTRIPRDPLGPQMLSWIARAPASFRPCKYAQLYFGNTTT